MSKVIIYKQENGVPAVVFPSESALQQMTLLEIAEKDVPSGFPFGIIDLLELPSTPQETWVIEDNDLVDGVGK